MGWASGSEIAGDVAAAAKVAIKDAKAREDFLLLVIRIFEGHDCDTLHECLGQDPAFDAALERAGYGGDGE